MRGVGGNRRVAADAEVADGTDGAVGTGRVVARNIGVAGNRNGGRGENAVIPGFRRVARQVGVSADGNRAGDVRGAIRAVRRIAGQREIAGYVQIAVRENRAVIVLDFGRKVRIIDGGVVRRDEIAVDDEPEFRVDRAADFRLVAVERNGDGRVGFRIGVEGNAVLGVNRAADDVAGRIARRFRLIGVETGGDDLGRHEGVDRAGAFRDVGVKFRVFNAQRAVVRRNGAAGVTGVRVEVRVLNDGRSHREDSAAEFCRVIAKLSGVRRDAVVGERTAVDDERSVVRDRAAETFLQVVAFDDVVLPDGDVVGEVDVIEGQVAVIEERAAEGGEAVFEGQRVNRGGRVFIDRKDASRLIAANGDVAVLSVDRDRAVDDQIAAVGKFAKVGVTFDLDVALRRIEGNRGALQFIGEGNGGFDRLGNARDSVDDFDRGTVLQFNRLLNAHVASRERPDRKVGESERSGVLVVDDVAVVEEERAARVIGVLAIDEGHVVNREFVTVFENVRRVADFQDVIRVTGTFLIVEVGSVDVVDVLLRREREFRRGAVGISETGGDVGDFTVGVLEVSAVEFVAVVDLNAVEQEFVAVM